ncbi:MAG: cytochrome P450, partial [Actinomycetia bacterium]|nr:cytochrome P450 [Actinomycetes bacterium]
MGWDEANRYARSAVVWGIRFGLPGFGLRTAARRGDLIARITADPRLRADPFGAYDELRDRGPLAYGRFVAATVSHPAAVEILRGEEFEAGQQPLEGGLLGRLVAAAMDRDTRGPLDPPSLLAIQPPQHSRIRKLVSRAFSAKAVAAYADRVREIAEELLDGIRNGDPFDLIGSYASLLPVTVIAEIMGVPTENRAEFLAWGNDAALLLDPDIGWAQYRRASAATRKLISWFGAHIDRLRADPGDDLLSQLVHATEDGDRLTTDELLATAMLLLVAGFETTVNLIGNGAALLLRHPDQLARLRAEPGGWAGAVEEILRYDSPVQATLRTAR